MRRKRKKKPTTIIGLTEPICEDGGINPTKIKHSEKSIQKLLESRFDISNIKFVVSNLYLFRHNWESDFLVVQRNSGYCYEIEIKISRADFLNDSKKVDKHSILKDGTYLVKKYKYRWDKELNKSVSEHNFVPTEWKFRPNKFYYCVPEGLIKPEEVPEYAGLMYVNEFGVTTVKEPKFIHKEKLSLEKPLCDKFYYYWRNEKNNNVSLIKEITKFKNEIMVLNEKLNKN
jgi:hypothetical protein